HDVDVITACVHGMEDPATNPTMVPNRLLHEVALSRCKDDGRFDHALPRLPFSFRVRRLDTCLAGFHPSPFITGQPRAIGRPGEVIGDWFHGRGSLRNALACAAGWGHVGQPAAQARASPTYRNRFGSR